MLFENTTNYSVPVLISNGLRQDECVLQIAEALQFLDKVSNEIFNKIGSKVSESKGRLQHLQDRIHSAQLKVDKMNGMHHASTVYSPATFPTQTDDKCYQSAFTGTDLNSNEISRWDQTLRHKFIEVDDNTRKEKTDYVFVNLKGNDSTEKENNSLKFVPSQIDSISSMVIYEKKLNRKYMYAKKCRRETEKKSTLPDPPFSIQHPDDSNTKSGETKIPYIPVLEEAPCIDVPDNLPELNGFVSNMSYEYHDEDTRIMFPSKVDKQKVYQGTLSHKKDKTRETKNPAIQPSKSTDKQDSDNTLQGDDNLLESHYTISNDDSNETKNNSESQMPAKDESKIELEQILPNDEHNHLTNHVTIVESTESSDHQPLTIVESTESSDYQSHTKDGLEKDDNKSETATSCSRQNLNNEIVNSGGAAAFLKKNEKKKEESKLKEKDPIQKRIDDMRKYTEFSDSEEEDNEDWI